jgi:hypothetical protein
MNLTLAVDDSAVERAREVARQQGTSLNALIRGYIDQLAGLSTGAAILREFEALWQAPRAGSGGYRFRREDVYVGRVAEAGEPGAGWPGAAPVAVAGSPAPGRTRKTKAGAATRSGKAPRGRSRLR